MEWIILVAIVLTGAVCMACVLLGWWICRVTSKTEYVPLMGGSKKSEDDIALSRQEETYEDVLQEYEK